jgi:Tol biopolymer transport system component/DNA-binding winged helix-turn-helix (wHTH) protein
MESEEALRGTAHPPVYRFGVFELNPHLGELRKHGLRMRLQEQPLRILKALVENSGEVVSREQLQAKLWAPDTYVDYDNAINSAVRKLRNALGDTAENPRFVETVARRGYRFIAPVSAGPVAPVATAPSPPPARSKWPVAAALVALAAVVAFAAWQLTRGPRIIQLAAPVPLTSYPGIACCPSFSPDGTQVAFAWNGPGQDSFDIYVKTIGPSEPLRLTPHAATDKYPAWSPDGRSIAFLREIDDRHGAIIVMPPMPGPERQVAVTGIGWLDLDYRAQGPPLAWSADGKFLFTIEAAGSSGVCSIVRVSSATGEKRRITRPPPDIAGDGGISVSPDGRTLAFTRTIAGLVNGDIYAIPLRDNTPVSDAPRRITFDSSRILGHGWSEDGREIVFSSNRGGRVELWRTDALGSKKPIRLTGAGESSDSLRSTMQLYPAVSRRGHRLVYAQPNIVGPDIRRLGLDGANQSVRLISSTRGELSPQYSPDGTKIAVHSNRFGRGEIWVSNADGSNPVKLTSFRSGFSGTPQWSPDGRSIAFDNSSAGNWDIYVVNAQGGSSIRLTANPAMDEVPSWSRGGDWIYFASNRSGRFEVWKTRVGGDYETQVTNNGGYMAIESADGKDLYYTKTEGASALWRRPVAGGEERIVVDSLYGRNFTVTKRHIWFMQRSGDSVALRSLGFNSSPAATVSSLGRFVFLGLTVSPDERWALYSQADVVGSDLMLVENVR